MSQSSFYVIIMLDFFDLSYQKLSYCTFKLKKDKCLKSHDKLKLPCRYSHGIHFLGCFMNNHYEIRSKATNPKLCKQIIETYIDDINYNIFRSGCVRLSLFT